MNEPAVEINGWSVYAHPLFLNQLEALIIQVETAKKKDPKGYRKKRVVKLLAAILKLSFEDIPGDPTRDIYRQGDTLGSDYKHWFRAKFFQQYRLFFRYGQSGSTKIIILSWVNDDDTLRAYESATDAYAVFSKMLKRGRPPDGWDVLLAEAATDAAKHRLKRAKPSRQG